MLGSCVSAVETVQSDDFSPIVVPRPLDSTLWVEEDEPLVPWRGGLVDIVDYSVGVTTSF